MKLFLFVLLLIASIYSTSYYVAGDGTGTSAEGTAWATAVHPDTITLLSITAGDTIYWKTDGTINGTIDMSTFDGTPAAPIVYIGVKTGTTNEGANIVYSDWAIDTADRPLTDIQAYRITFGDYSKVFNLHFIGNFNQICAFGLSAILYNDMFNHTQAATHGEYTIAVGVGSIIDSCQIFSTGGNGLLSASNVRAVHSYFDTYVSAIGVNAANTIIGNIFSGCGKVVISTADDDGTFMNNTVYKCFDIFDMTDCETWLIENNIIDSTETSVFNWDTYTRHLFIWNNNCDVNRNATRYTNVDSTGVHSDYKEITGDPGMTDPESGDFTLGAGSSCRDAATW